MKYPLLHRLQKQLPTIKFVEAATFYWSPQTSTIYINSGALGSEEGQWALLHEAAHALLKHQSYKTDAALLTLEVEAWQSAQEMGKNLEVEIDEEHIQDCLNTYRDWLYARSTCPTCTLNSLQIDETTYLCMNCSTRWSVSQSRFCRPYRMQDRHKKTPTEVNHVVFL
jgi:hypothetical protein